MAARHPLIIWACRLGALTLACWALYQASTSPLLEWRSAIYIAAGLAGVLGLIVLLFQPMLALGLLRAPNPRQYHRALGFFLLLLVIIHIGGLWLTSPPDVIDALLLRSPTPFSLWGVLAMWALIATAILALRRRALGPRLWSLLHRALALVLLGGTVLHALLITGTMGTTSKAILCAAAVVAGLAALAHRRAFPRR